MTEQQVQARTRRKPRSLAQELVTVLTEGNHRLAILSTGGFFLLGWWVLAGVDVARGMTQAHPRAGGA